MLFRAQSGLTCTIKVILHALQVSTAAVASTCSNFAPPPPALGDAVARQQGRPGQNSISVALIFANFLVDAAIRPAGSGTAPRPAALQGVSKCILGSRTMHWNFHSVNAWTNMCNKIMKRRQKLGSRSRIMAEFQLKFPRKGLKRMSTAACLPRGGSFQSLGIQCLSVLKADLPDSDK